MGLSSIYGTLQRNNGSAPVLVNCNADNDAASRGEVCHQQSSPTPEWYKHYQISKTQNLRLRSI
jgi:hypothetical protein